MQCACAILSSVACPVLQYIPKLSHKRQDFRKKKCIRHCTKKECFGFLYNCLPNCFSLKKIQRILPQIYIGSHLTCPLFLSRFNENWIFSKRFLKNTEFVKFHENPFSGSRVVPCGRTENAELIVAFRSFREKRLKPARCISSPSR